MIRDVTYEWRQLRTNGFVPTRLAKTSTRRQTQGLSGKSVSVSQSQDQRKKLLASMADSRI
jgi:hypothetical protein